MIVESINKHTAIKMPVLFKNLCNSYLYKKALCEDVGIRLNILELT